MGILNFTGIIVSVIVILSGSSFQEVNSQAIREIEWFDCNGTVGNLVHPRDCTRFIMCADGGRAFESDCGECSQAQGNCPVVNRLVYNLTLNQCLWSHQTKCETEVGGETRPMNVGAFDCGGYEGKHFPHPQDCTKFIQCSVSGKPFEHDCGRCDDVPDRCTQWNRLIYDTKADKCMFTNEATCENGGGGTTALKVNAEIVLIFLGISAYLCQRFN